MEYFEAMIYDLKNKSKSNYDNQGLTELIGGIVKSNNMLRRKAKDKLEALSQIGFNENGIHNAAYSSTVYLKRLRQEASLDVAEDLVEETSKNLEILISEKA